MSTGNRSAESRRRCDQYGGPRAVEKATGVLTDRKRRGNRSADSRSRGTVTEVLYIQQE